MVIKFRNITLTILLMWLGIVKGQSLYTIPLADIDGNVMHLAADSGKKILFLLAPFSQQQDSLAQQIRAFALSHTAIKVIGILSIEDGYSIANKADAKSLYAGSSVALTEGMHTRKGSSQSPLMQWLTNRSYNRHFDQEAQGIGHKFFVNERGRLYAVIGRETSFTAPVINRIVAATPSTSN